jgi:hypothetical protein
MSKRTRPDGPCRTKATYDHKRPRRDPPSPEQERVALDDAKRAAEKSRAFAQRVTKVGLYGALREVAPEKFPEKKSDPIIRRRG